jgi:CRP/FNR family transcriptional regulator, nitrogen oxide reductase regulator
VVQKKISLKSTSQTTHSSGWAAKFATADAFNEPERFITAFFSYATVGVGIFDTQLRYIAINEALAQMHGVPLKDHLGKELHEILGHAFCEQIQPLFRPVLTNGRAVKNVEVTAFLPTRNLVGRWVGSTFPVFDRAGKLKHIGITVVEPSTHPTLVDDDLHGKVSRDPAVAMTSTVLVKQPSVLKPSKLGEGLGSTLFDGLPRDTTELILKTATVRRCSPGEFFCVQGEEASTLFLLKRGRVKLCGATRSGREVLLDWMLPGEVFGLGTLVARPTQYLWSVVAVEESEALTWRKADVTRLAQLLPHTFENALQIAERWCAKLQQRFEELSDGVVERRLAHLTLALADRLSNLGPTELSVSDAELAQMAGTNLYSVNKVLNRWQRQGYVQKGRRRLIILDRGKIKRLSDLS